MDGWGVRSAGKARCVRQRERAAETCGFGAGRSVRAGAGQAAGSDPPQRLPMIARCLCGRGANGWDAYTPGEERFASAAGDVRAARSAGAGQAARGRNAERLRRRADCFCKILRAGGWKGRFIFDSLLKFYLVKKRGTMI